MDADATNGGHGRGRLRENSPFARERPDAAPHVSAAMEPVALEDRLRVAREQRAEALARRQASVRPRPPAPRQALRAPAHDPIEPAQPAPSLSVRRPHVAAPAHETSAPAQVAHPLVALVALGLTVAFALSHGAPVAPRADPAVASSPAVAPPARTPTIDIAAASDPTPPHADDDPLSARSGAAGPMRVEGAAAELGLADPFPAAAVPVANAPAGPAESTAEPATAAVEPPIVVARRTQSVLVNAPSSVPADATLATLRTSGFGEVALQPTRLTIRTSSVRYYHAADAAAAAEVAALIGPGLPGGRAEARDFSDASSLGAPGHLEVWIASAPTPAAAPEPEPAHAAGAVQTLAEPETAKRETAEIAAAPPDGVDPDQIRRLVESVFSTRPLDDLGSGAADLALEMENGANIVARGVVTDTVRRLEGRP